jgi:integrase/recombinase XerD
MSSSLAPMLQYFFTEHLVSHRQVSPQTIVAYRDSFRLLLQFLKKRTGKKPASQRHSRQRLPQSRHLSCL